MAYGNNNNNKKSTPPTPVSSYEYGPPPSLNGDMSALGATASTGIDPQFVSFGPPPTAVKVRNLPGVRKRREIEPWKRGGQQGGQVEQQRQQAQSELMDARDRAEQQRLQGLNGDVSALGFTAQSGIEPMSEFLDDPRVRKEGQLQKKGSRGQPAPATDYGTGPGHNTSRRRGRRRRTTGLSTGYGNQNW